jgi:hypothetical protein
VVLNCINNGLDILVNGNLANRISFDGTLPYQNFQDLVLFSTVRSNILGQGGIPVVMDGDPFCFTGSFNGYVSNLIYARYGLSMIEVLNLMRKGPSSKTSARLMERPPYLADDWWANQSDT